jgi:hypothetical protein
MRWFRLHASRIATVAMLSLVSVGLSSAGPHQDDCHEGCQPFAVEHDASAHHVTAPAGADDQPLHCLVCHWTRSFRLRTEARVVTAPAVEPGVLLRVEFFTAAVSAPVAQPPLRSPPAPALSLS